MSNGHKRYGSGEQEYRIQVTKARLLSDEITSGGAERKGEEDRQPVEPLATRGDDRVNRKRALHPVPGREDQRECKTECDSGRVKGYAVVVGEIVAYERPHHADED